MLFWIRMMMRKSRTMIVPPGGSTARMAAAPSRHRAPATAAAMSVRRLALVVLLAATLLVHLPSSPVVVVRAYSKQGLGGAAPVGLTNLGNTCYINAQLQCAYHIPLVRRLVLEEGAAGQDDDDDDDDATVATEASGTSSSSDDGDDEEGDDNKSPLESNSNNSGGFVRTQQKQADQARIQKENESVALQSLRRVFGRMRDGRTGPAVVAPLCTNLGISVWEQQDAQEFWKLLLPALEVPALKRLYAGEYQDYIVALDGTGRERRRAEAFLDLSLDLDATVENTVVSSLQTMFGAPELLSAAEGNGWRPEKDSEKVDAHKGSLLLGAGLPPILQLHLKRFHFDWNTETTTKLNHPLHFPQQLDLSGLIAGDDGTNDNNSNCRYVLQAVVVHVGEFGAGHYYAYVRPNVRDPDSTTTWYRFNDDVVEAVQWEDVVRDAYGGTWSGSTTTVAKSNREDSDSATTGSDNNQGNMWSRLLRNVFGRGDNKKQDPYGYGGPKSSAYVLQYVRQCDIPRLYDV